METTIQVIHNKCNSVYTVTRVGFDCGLLLCSYCNSTKGGWIVNEKTRSM